MSCALRLLSYDPSLLQILENRQQDTTTSRHTSTTMDILDEAPPSYSDAISIHKTASGPALETEDAWFEAPTLPPLANYLVRRDSEPSAWKLLVGPAMSNAITPFNDDPIRKRRYRVLFPPGYEDVYLHKSTWSANTSSLPRFHVELYGRERYETEPIVILGPIDHDSTREIRNIAARYIPRAFLRIEDKVLRTTRFTMFCESEYLSWDWRCKTASAVKEMRRLVDAAKIGCSRSASLLAKSQQLLEFVGEKGFYEKVIRSLRLNLAQACVRLDRLKL